MIKILILVFCLLLKAGAGGTQSVKSTDQSIALNYLQIKEGLNFGMVFRGPGLEYAHGWHWNKENSSINLDVQGGMTYLAAKGISAMSFHLQPVKLNYLFNLGRIRDLYIGPSLVAEYYYQLYPDLQSGYSFWLTNYSIGAGIQYQLNFGNDQLIFLVNTSLVGMTSRPPVYREPYFFDLSFGDAIHNLNNDLQFGSWGQYNVSQLEIRWLENPGAHIGLSYVIQYAGYYENPNLTIINQFVKLVFIPKQNKNE